MVMKSGRVKLLIVCTATLCALTLCKKDVDYDVEGSADTVSETDTATALLEDETKLQETFYSSENGGYIEVDATVEMQQGSSAYPVARLKDKELADTDIKNIAEAYFDENSIQVVDFWETGDDMNDIKWYEREDGLRYCYLTGTRNGISMDMNFSDSREEQDPLDSGIQVNISRSSEYGRGFNRISADDGNVCSYTKEQALDVAGSFLNELGFDGYENVDISSAQEYVFDASGDASYSVNGWEIELRRSVNGVAIPCIYPMFASDDGYYYESVNLVVTDDGVMGMNLSMPAEVEEISTEASSLLSFDDLDRLAKDYFENTYLVKINLEEEDEPIEINDIELGLAQITGEDSNSYLIPAWYYIYKDSDGYKWALAIFNAIDGSTVK